LCDSAGSFDILFICATYTQFGKLDDYILFELAKECKLTFKTRYPIPRINSNKKIAREETWLP
jgi:hypothetical protein